MKLSQKIYVIAAGLFFLSVPLSCSQSRENSLAETIRKYNNALRWKGYMAAGTLVSDEIRRKFIAEKLQELQDRNIVDATVLDMVYDKTKKKADVIMLYSEYLNSTGNLTQTQERQVWKYIKNGWKLCSYEKLAPAAPYQKRTLNKNSKQNK